MATNILRDDEGYLLQGVKFNGKIDNYIGPLGLNPDDVKQVKADFVWFAYEFKAMKDFRDYSQAVTAFKDLQRHGIGNQLLGDFPQPPKLELPPVDKTLANAQSRFATLIQLIVKNPKYSKTIGEDLGIIAPDTPFDPQTGKPALKTTFSSGGHPHLLWKKGKFQGIEIWKDSADGKGWL